MIFVAKVKYERRRNRNIVQNMRRVHPERPPAYRGDLEMRNVAGNPLDIVPLYEEEPSPPVYTPPNLDRFFSASSQPSTQDDPDWIKPPPDAPGPDLAGAAAVDDVGAATATAPAIAVMSEPPAGDAVRREQTATPMGFGEEFEFGTL